MRKKWERDWEREKARMIERLREEESEKTDKYGKREKLNILKDLNRLLNETPI